MPLSYFILIYSRIKSQNICAIYIDNIIAKSIFLRYILGQDQEILICNIKSFSKSLHAWMMTKSKRWLHVNQFTWQDITEVAHTSDMSVVKYLKTLGYVNGLDDLLPHDIAEVI